MPKVCFRTNVGSVDAKSFGLGEDLAKLVKGAELDVSDEVARQVCTPDPQTGVQLADPVVSDSKVKAVPKVEVKT